VPIPHSPAKRAALQPLLEALPSPSSLGGAAKPSFSSRLVYLQFAWGCAPPPFSSVQGIPPSLLHVFFQLLIIQFVVVVVGWGQSVQGAMLIYLRGSCGSTVCCLFTHLLVCISQGLGACSWWCGSPPVFSVYHGMGKLCGGWGCGGVGVLPLLGGFFLPGVSLASQQDFYFDKHTLATSSL
jgi:hypothetical protein